MRLSKTQFTALRFPPKDADTINHRLLVQAGYVRQLMAGVYTYLPLGLRVLRKIEQVVREEMNNLGSEEVLMPALHPNEIWRTTGGWDNVDVLFKLKSRTDKEYALGQSHEEVVTPLVSEFANSYRQMPASVYQIQWKYRDELRSKSGILRGREFLMKDMYSFHLTQDDFDDYYAAAKKAYLKIFARLGLVAKVTEASGGAFSSKISYEFMVLTDAGEDDIYYCEDCDYCINTEIAKVKEGDPCPKCESALKMGRASEVGNVFDLGTKYSQAFGYKVTNDKGEQVTPIMGCYGIGISRSMGVIVEKNHDEKGIVWPESIAPYKYLLVDLRRDGTAETVYQQLLERGVEVLYDDRDLTAGSKLAEADLLGIPYRLVIGKETGDKIELKKRNEQEVKLVSVDEL